MIQTIPATHLILNAGSYSPNISTLNTPFWCIHSFKIVIRGILVRIFEKRVTSEKRNSVANAATLFFVEKNFIMPKQNLIKSIHFSFGGQWICTCFSIKCIIWTNAVLTNFPKIRVMVYYIWVQNNSVSRTMIKILHKTNICH